MHCEFWLWRLEWSQSYRGQPYLSFENFGNYAGLNLWRCSYLFFLWKESYGILLASLYLFNRFDFLQLTILQGLQLILLSCLHLCYCCSCPFSYQIFYNDLATSSFVKGISSIQILAFTSTWGLQVCRCLHSLIVAWIRLEIRWRWCFSNSCCFKKFLPVCFLELLAFDL